MQTNYELLQELFEAYFEARRNKRNTVCQLLFELDYENRLVALAKAIDERSYRPERSICFVVDKPVKREIFAAGFVDRVVHHLLYRQLAPLFTPCFIYDSYACLEGSGTAGASYTELFGKLPVRLLCTETGYTGVLYVNRQVDAFQKAKSAYQCEVGELPGG